MKRFLIVLLILFFAANAHAFRCGMIGAIANQGGDGGGGGGSGPCDSCGTCGGCAAADIACEDWDTDNSCSWTDDTDSGAAGTISHTASHSGTWGCTDKGSYCLDILVDDDTTGDCYTRFDMGEAKGTEGTDYYIHFSYMQTSKGDLATFQSMKIIQAESSTMPDFGNINLRFYQSGSSSYELRLYMNGSTLAATASSISLSTHYEIGIRWKVVTGSDNDEVQLYVDGVSQGSKTDTDLSETPRYIYFGTGSTSSNYYNARFQIDNLEIDDDTMPSDCPE